MRLLQKKWSVHLKIESVCNLGQPHHSVNYIEKELIEMKTPWFPKLINSMGVLVILSRDHSVCTLELFSRSASYDSTQTNRVTHTIHTGTQIILWYTEHPPTHRPFSLFIELHRAIEPTRNRHVTEMPQRVLRLSDGMRVCSITSTRMFIYVTVLNVYTVWLIASHTRSSYCPSYLHIYTQFKTNQNNFGDLMSLHKSL